MKQQYIKSRTKRKLICQWTTIALLITGVGIAIQFICSRNLIYSQFARVLGGIVAKNPDMEESWMLAIKEANVQYEVLGGQVLERYGYSASNIPFGSGGLVAVSSIIIGSLVIGASFFYINKLQRQTEARIDALTQYLREAKEGKSKSLSACEEDEFSLLEDEIYKAVGELYQTKKVVVQEKLLLKDHIANIAHQIKTPLTSMGMMCELLEKTDSQEEAKIYKEQIQDQLDRLDGLVHTLLALSKLETNVIQLEKKPISVYILILRVLELLEPQFLAKRQKIEIVSPLDEAITFNGDMKWSIEALSNLIKNAIEHTPEGKCIYIYYKKTPLYTFISIEDEGSGFEEEDIPHLFERFYKGKHTTKESVGIGLALAKAIIVKQNGVIEAENRKEGGARFNIRFYSK